MLDAATGNVIREVEHGGKVRGAAGVQVTELYNCLSQLCRAAVAFSVSHGRFSSAGARGWIRHISTVLSRVQSGRSGFAGSLIALQRACYTPT